MSEIYPAVKAKAMTYCAFQERSQQEVRDKLYFWGLHGSDVEHLLAELISENFINEERFALAYASGKHRLKKWGIYKIRQGLQQKSVSAPLIRQALESIDPQQYRANLSDLLQKKSALSRESDPRKRSRSLLNYALSKGYEQSLIMELLKDNGLEEI